MCENPPSLPPGKGILLSWTRREKYWLAKSVWKAPVSTLSKYFCPLLRPGKGVKKWLTWHHWSESVWPLFLGWHHWGNVRPLFILGLGLHHCISFVRPFDGEELWGIPWPIHTTGVPAESHATPSQKKRLGKGGGHGKVPTTCPRGEH